MNVSGITARLAAFGPQVAGRTFLVTGGSGFLGSWTCEVLLEMGGQVVCLDNLSSGQCRNVEHLMGHSDFKFVEGDVRAPPVIDGGLDYVLHLASRADPFEFERHPLDILETNSVGTMRMLGLAKERGARTFLLASTSECYGDAEVVPTPESYRGNVSTTGPRACYDESKRFAEAYSLAFGRQHGLDVRIARIFNTYGPRLRADGVMYGRVVANFIRQALAGEPLTVHGDGGQTRSFCYMTDTVEGLLRVLLDPRARGEVFNIGSERETTILGLAQLVRRLTGSGSEITFRSAPKDDPRRRRPDLAKARALLDYRPSVSLEDGLKATLEWLGRETK